MAGRTDIDAEALIGEVRRAFSPEWGDPHQKDAPNTGGLHEPLPANGPLGGWSAGLAVTSARHREMLVQFGKVYDDGYCPALSIRRRPIRYTARDLF